jgi:ATP-binding cassette, subfamily B, bacterial
MSSSRTATLRQARPALARVLHRFAPLIREQRRLLVLGLVALLLEVGLRLVEPWPLGYVIDSVVVAAGGDVDGRGAGGLPLQTVLVVCAVATVAAVALRAGASYAMTIFFALAGNRVLTRVRAQVYAHLNALSMDFHDRRRTGDLVTRVTGDVGRLQDATITALLPLTGNVVTLVGMFAVIAVLDWRLALMVLAMFPVFFLTSIRLTKRLNGVAKTQRAAEGKLASLATESLGAMKLVHSFSLEERMQQRFGGSNAKSLRDGVKATKLSAGLERKTDLLVGVATGLVIYFGASRVLRGELTPGELTVFLTYLKTAFKPMRDIAKYTARIAKAAASGERIIDVLDEQPAVVDAAWARPAPPFRGDVRFDGVHLSYVPGKPVLRGLDFAVPAGTRVAVVGPSGAGKSTLVALLSRLRDPDPASGGERQGRVLIDGHDLRDLTLASVRAQISVVLQESVLFAASIRDNIAFGVPHEVSDAEIEAAARLAGAHDFIVTLPDGYDTVVGERGSTLSGGERQRIAIARAAIRNAPVVVLDEALTGLDTETESEVVGALGRLTAGRTTFVITHDLDAARDADLVVWIEAGTVARMGPAAEVLPDPMHSRPVLAAAGSLLS